MPDLSHRAANRGSISTTYEIDNSIRLEAANPEELHYTTGSSSSDHDKGTFAFWMKKGERGHFSPMQINDFAAPYHSGMYFQSGTGNLADRLYMSHKDNDNSWTSWDRKFRDHSAWYHIVVRVDTTLATADDRIQLWVNGVRETQFNTTDSYNSPPGQNDAHFWFDTGRKMTVGGVSTGSGYFADYHYIDGQSVAPSEFGEFDEDSGIWKPKKYGGSFGNNGFKLEFKETGTSANASGIGADTSGNGHHFTLINIDATNQCTDTPTNNFCTLNPNDRTVNDSYDGQLKDGNLEYQPEGGTSVVRGTMGMSKGKWYWEAKLATYAGQSLGVCTTNMDIPVTSTQEGGWIGASVGGDAHVFSLYANSAYRSYFFYDGSNSNSANSFASGTFTYGDIFGFAFDADNLDIYISKKGSWTDVKASQDPEGDPGSNTAYVYHASFNTDEDDTWLPIVSNTYNQDMILNFGNPTFAISSSNADANGYGNFEYAVPSGYYALCTKNLSEFG